MVEAIIDTHMRANTRFHDIFHGIRMGRGIGTAILELKVAKNIARFDKYPLLLVFLDLQKSYDTVDLGHHLTTLDGYISGSHMRDILEEFW